MPKNLRLDARIDAELRQKLQELSVVLGLNQSAVIHLAINRLHRQEIKTMTSQPTYYVRVDTYWQNALDYFVGPFASREEAQAEIDRAVNDPRSLVVPSNRMAGDLKNSIRVHGILSKTEAKKAGMRNEFDSNNVVGKRIPRNGDDLHRMTEYNA